MNITHKLFYRKHGVRKPNDMVSPPVNNWEEFSLPMLSIFNHMDTTGDNPIPDPRHHYLTYSVKVPLVPILEYHNPIGRTTHTNRGETYVKRQKSKIRDYNWIKPGEALLANNFVPIVYTYGVLPLTYKYTPTPLNTYYSWRNTWETFYHKYNDVAKKQPRASYIIIDTPVEVPTNAQFKKLAKKDVTRRTLVTLTTERRMNIYDIWLWIDPETRDKSLLSRVESKLLSKLVFVLKHNNVWFALNVGKLNDFVKSDISPDGKYEGKLIQKAFLKGILELNLKGKEESFVVEDNNVAEQSAAISDKVDVEQTDDLLDEVNEEMPDDDIVEESDSAPSVNPLETKDAFTRLEDKVEEVRQDKGITKANRDSIAKSIERIRTQASPYNDGTKLIDNLTVSEEDLKIEDKPLMPDSPSVLDKAMLHSPQIEVSKKYIKEVMRKDKLSTIYSVLNAGIAIDSHEVIEEENILGATETHVIQLNPVDGAKSTIRIRLPKVSEDGEFQISGNSYVARKQRVDYPIRKIAANKVALTSYYGKVFITRGRFRVDDAPYALYKRVIVVSTEDNSPITQMVGLGVTAPYVDAPREYSMLARNIKSVETKQLTYFYDYTTRHTLLDPETTTKVESKGKYILAGVSKKKEPLLLDKSGNYFLLVDGKHVSAKSLVETLGLDLESLPPEAITIRIFRAEIPIVYLLLHRFGFKKLTKLLKTPYRSVVGNRVSLEPYEFRVRFSDGSLVFDNRDILTGMIFGGMRKIKKLKDHFLSDLDQTTTLTALLHGAGYSPMSVRELDVLNDMFIDPMTMSILEAKNEPKTWTGLVLKACDLLKNDYYKSETDMDEMVIKGYERFSGMMYKHLVGAVRDYRSKSLYRKAKIDIDPFAVWRDINSDSASGLVDDINPVTALKQHEEVTYLGHGGRTSQTLNAASRAYQKSDLGVISEASKDSSDVGVSFLMSANAKLSNVRGFKGEFDIKKDGFASVLSTSAALAPGVIYDSPARANFVSVQNSHTVPIIGKEPPWVRTGYESVLAHKLGKRFVLVAAEDGRVTSVKGKLQVKYKSGAKDSVVLGTMTSKEETNATFLRNMVTDLAEGSKFSEGDVLAFDSSFFIRDIFNKKQVVYTATATLRTAFGELNETHEDSSAISKRSLETFQLRVAKVKSFVLKFDQHITEFKHKGSKVTDEDFYMFIENTDPNLHEDLDSENQNILQLLKRQAPRIKYNGKIVKVEVFYNGELEDMSPTLREIATRYDKDLKKRHNNPKITGKVTAEKSVQGQPITEGMLEIKFYIETVELTGGGDKVVFANQMKSTIGAVLQNDIFDENGEQVDAFFGERSVQARIISSAKQIGTTSMLLKAIAKKAVEAYDK